MPIGTHRQNIDLISFNIDRRPLSESRLWHIILIWFHVVRIDDSHILRVHIVRYKVSRVLFVPLSAKNVQFSMALWMKETTKINQLMANGVKCGLHTWWKSIECVTRDLMLITSGFDAVGCAQSTRICVQVLVPMWYENSPEYMGSFEKSSSIRCVKMRPPNT